MQNKYTLSFSSDMTYNVFVGMLNLALSIYFLHIPPFFSVLSLFCPFSSPDSAKLLERAINSAVGLW